MVFWNKENPLGLPPGSVRALLALFFVVPTVIGGLIAHFKGMPALAKDFWTMAAIVAAFYFGMRKSENGTIEPITCEEVKEIATETIKETVSDDCIE